MYTMSEIKLAVVRGLNKSVERAVERAIGTESKIVMRADSGVAAFGLVSYLALYGEDADALVMPAVDKGLWEAVQELHVSPALIAVESLFSFKSYGPVELAAQPDYHALVTESHRLTDPDEFNAYLRTIWDLEQTRQAS
jgi:hypothetical protein